MAVRARSKVLPRTLEAFTDFASRYICEKRAPLKTSPSTPVSIGTNNERRGNHETGEWHASTGPKYAACTLPFESSCAYILELPQQVSCRCVQQVVCRVLNTVQCLKNSGVLIYRRCLPCRTRIDLLPTLAMPKSPSLTTLERVRKMFCVLRSR